MTQKELRDAIIENGRKFIIGVEAWYFPDSVPEREDFLNVMITEVRNHVEEYFNDIDKGNARYNDHNETNRT